MTVALARSDDRAFVLRHAVAQLLLWSAFYYLFPALLPTIAASTGWSAIGLSAALTAGMLIWALLSPFAGHLIDNGYGAVGMAVAGVLGAAVLALLAATSTEAVAYAALVVIGVPMAMTLYDPCFALILRRFGPGPAAAQGITTVTLIAGFATLLTFPLVAGLLAAGVGWRAILALFGVAAVAAAALLPRGAQDAVAVARPRGLRFSPRLLQFGLAFGLVIFAHTVLLFQIPALLASSFPGQSSLLLPMIFGPAQVAGRLVWRRVQGRVPPRAAAPVLFAALAVPPVLLAVALGVPSLAPALALAAIVLQGAGFGVHTILRPTLVAAWFPGPSLGATLGSVAMIGLLLMALGPLAGGVTLALGGPGAVLVLSFGAVVAALACLAPLARSSTTARAAA